MQKRTLTQIWIYPVKSLGGIRVSSAKVMEKGLRFDRRWMLIDDNGKFMTQRSSPRMSLFKLTFEGESMRISYKGDSILLAINGLTHGEAIKAEVWGDQVDVLEVDKTFNNWVSQRLEVSCRLVSFPEQNPRPVEGNTGSVSLADGFPILIIGQASLDDLNARLEKPVPMNRFRPNLVFTGGTPYEEDGWKEFKVGANRFEGTRPCGRCVITTVDQATGEKGREPLLTLSRYRKNGENIYFGENAIAIDHNEIHEGDEIIVF